MCAKSNFVKSACVLALACNTFFILGYCDRVEYDKRVDLISVEILFIYLYYLFFFTHFMVPLFQHNDLAVPNMLINMLEA